MHRYNLRNTAGMLRILTAVMITFLLLHCSAENEASSAANESAAPAQAANETAKAAKKTILFLGNSLSAGFGLDPAQAFPALIQVKIDSMGWDYEVINGGLSGETTAAGARRIDWLLRRKIDILVIELGGNDGLRGIPPEETRKNLMTIIDKTRASNADAEIILSGMEVPPNMGNDYAVEFRKVFPKVADEKSVGLIPFLLEGVGGIPELNLPDGIHPTAAGHEIVANNVWKFLKPILAVHGAASK